MCQTFLSIKELEIDAETKVIGSSWVSPVPTSPTQSNRKSGAGASFISFSLASELRPVGAFSQLPITNYQLPINN